MLAAAAAAADPDAVVHVSLVAPGYTAANAPVMPPVKFGKAAPLCMISDDMSLSDYCSTWALFNGYPHSATTKDRQYPRGDLLLDQSVRDIPEGFYDGDADFDGVPDGVHEPLTFSDGAGGRRRFACSSAIFAYTDGNYLQITPEDVRSMMRTGWSCTFHDIDGADVSDAESIAARFAPLSARWEARTGQGLKIMTEPNGNHVYLDACRLSPEICWSIFQNAAAGYPANPMELAAWTDRSAGLPSSFESKPQGGFYRIWAQGNEGAFSNAVNAVISSGAGTTIILAGTHGMGDAFKGLFANAIRDSDLFWVASVDEIWEYYWLYHNASIENLAFDAASQRLSFDVRLPACAKHRFREVTVNLPGLSGASGFAFEGAVTAGAAQNADGVTMNLGVEEHVLSDIDELLALREEYVANPCIARDAQYLIDLLAPGPEKAARQARLDEEWKYSWVVKSTTGETLFSGRCNEPTNVTYAVPLFFLHGTDLYRLDPDRYEGKWFPQCGGSFSLDDATPSYSTNWLYRIGEGYGIGWSGVVLFAEGEDLLPAARVDDPATAGLSMQAAARPEAGADVSLGRLPSGRYKFGYKYQRPSGTPHATWSVVTNGTVAWSAYNTKNEAATTLLSDEFTLPRGADVAFRVEPASGSLCELVDCVWVKRIGDIDTAPALGTVSAAATATAATVSVQVDSLGWECTSATVSATLGGETKVLDVRETGTFEFSFDGLAPATEYAWSVSVVSDGGDAADSGSVATDVSRPVFTATAAAARSAGLHSVTVEVDVEDLGPAADSAEISVSLGGATKTVSAAAAGVSAFVFDGLEPSAEYAWTAVADNGIGTARAAGTATTRPPAVAAGSAEAAVADDQRSAVLSAEVAVDSPGSTVTLRLDGVAVRSWHDLEGSNTLSHEVETEPGRTYAFSFVAEADGETASAAGSFAAYVVTGLFHVRWTQDGYPEGAAWDSDPAAQARSGGVWSRTAEAETALSGGRLAFSFSEENPAGALVFTPADAAADGGGLVVEGVIDARA
ncbi:MAG: hypothetical protein IJ783_10275, partial [Kiritimatiellae bacterium]|nr:hypothetical protein [Kiritimatiellia bacterium]